MDDDRRMDREGLRRSAVVYTLAELGHALSTPLNVLTGRLDLLDGADDLEEAKAHAAAMRRQVDKLVAMLGEARERIPDPSVGPVDVTTMAERVEASLRTVVEVKTDGAARVAADVDEVVGAALAMVDHLDGEADVVIETRRFDEPPGPHLAPGSYVCLVATKSETAPKDASEAVWALAGARGHARLSRATVLVPCARELVVVFRPMS